MSLPIPKPVLEVVKKCQAQYAKVNGIKPSQAEIIALAVNDFERKLFG